MGYVYPKFSKNDFLNIRIGGAGLGNLLFSYARALILEKKYGLKMIEPTWECLKIGVYFRREKERRKYSQLFRNNNSINGFKKLVIRLVCPVITEEEFNNGKEVDGKILEVFGNTDYFLPLMQERDFIRQELISSINPIYTENLKGFDGECIGVHIRMGDFVEFHEQRLKPFVNMRLPLVWYILVINHIRQLYGRNILVNVFTDAHENQIHEILNVKNCSLVHFGSPISDMLALSRCKLMIGSASTFSMWANYLGQNHAVWYSGSVDQKMTGDDSYRIESSLPIRFSEEDNKLLSSIFNAS